MSKYFVKSGDSVWGIALKQLGDGRRYKEILKENNLSENSVIHSGQQLIIPSTPPQYNKSFLYIVKSGDNLSKIAYDNYTTVEELRRLNNINNPNNIRVGQTISLPNHTSKKYTPKVRSISQIKSIELEINKGSDLDIINYYHGKNKNNQVYIVDDKKNNKLSVYRNGILIKSYKAIHGKNRDLDDMTITHTDKNGKIINLGGNLSTPAGVYFTTKGGVYHGAPSFIRRTKEQVSSNNPKGIPSSIHARTITENANTNGCTGVSVEDLKDLAKYIDLPNVPTYILPADSRNKFFIRNGELQFKSHDIKRTPSYNTVVSKPIKYIKYNTQGLNDTNKKVISQFNSGLLKNKLLLQKDLGLNNDTYNNLALHTLGILGVESGYGNENTAVGNLVRAVRKHYLKNNSSPDYKSKYHTYGINKDNNSVGLTLIRFSLLSKREKLLFDKYGITKLSLVDDPSKAAVATMIKLGLNYLDRGLNIDKAVSGWNAKPSYLTLVLNNMQRFNIYEMYKSGGTLEYNGMMGINQFGTVPKFQEGGGDF